MARSHLGDTEGRYLLAFARFTIEEALGASSHAPQIPPSVDRLREAGAAFCHAHRPWCIARMHRLADRSPSTP